MGTPVTVASILTVESWTKPENVLSKFKISIWGLFSIAVNNKKFANNLASPTHCEFVPSFFELMCDPV